MSPVPGQPSISLDSTTATTISLSWSVLSNSVVTSYEVMWQKFSSARSSGSTTRAEDGVGNGTSGEITNSSTSYTIEGLKSGTFYSITVRVANAAGNTDSPTVNVATSKEGKRDLHYVQYVELRWFSTLLM